jgi:hypothetical protein
LQHASAVRLGRIRCSQRTIDALTRPPPFTHRSAAPQLSLRRACITPPPLTNHSVTLDPSLQHSSLPPFIPPHGQPPLIEPQLVQLSKNSNPGPFPRRATVAIRQVANPSIEHRTAARDHLLVEQNSDRSPSRCVTHIRHPSNNYSAIYESNSPTRVSRRSTAAPPSTTDRHRSPSVRSLDVQLTPVKIRLAQRRIEQPLQTSPRTTEDTTASRSYSRANSPLNSPSQSPCRPTEGG